MLPTRLNLINFFSQLYQVVGKFTYNQPIFNYYVRSINQLGKRPQPTKSWFISWLIEDARETIAKLRNVADNISAVKKAAEQCAKLPDSIKPEQYSGWKSVTSQAGVETAVKAYKKKFDKPLYKAAKCQAVVTRAMRVMK